MSSLTFVERIPYLFVRTEDVDEVPEDLMEVVRSGWLEEDMYIGEPGEMEITRYSDDKCGECGIRKPRVVTAPAWRVFDNFGNGSFIESMDFLIKDPDDGEWKVI